MKYAGIQVIMYGEVQKRFPAVKITAGDQKRRQDFMKTGCSNMDLSGIWELSVPERKGEREFSGTVRLPGSMDENGKGADNTGNISSVFLNRDRIYTGPAVYQRKIRIPREWEGRRILLFLERTRKTRVWLDGIRIGSGQQKSYTAPHVYRLGDRVEAGEHILSVEVDNSPSGLPEAMYTTFEKNVPWGHMVTEHTQTNWNGILGEMRLTALPAVYIREFRIRPHVERKTAEVTIKLARSGEKKELTGRVELRASSYNHKGPVHQPEACSLLFHFEKGREETEIALEYEMGADVLLWDEFSPVLYRMTAEVCWPAGEEYGHSAAEESFGMRKFETLYLEDGGKQFAVNGRPVQLRGEINCAVFPASGYAPADQDSWMRIMKIYKEYGMNHVRFHTWVPPRAAFRAADLLGVYVQFELPQWGYKMFGDIDHGDTSAADYYWEESMKIFAWVLNSPSAVMMALGNELRPGFYYYDEFLTRLKEAEPQLLYTDIAGWSAYTDHVDFSASVPTCGENYLHRTDPSTDWDHGDNVRKTPVPFLAHEAGQLQIYPDYEKEIRKYSERGALLKPRNLEYFRSVLREAGMEGCDRRFSRSSGKLAAELYRYITESYLRTPGAGGFHLLGLQDFPGQGTALIGMLDAFLESKGHIASEEFRRSCCELAVLARLPGFVWKNDGEFEADLVISNYSRVDLRTAVAWCLQDENGQKAAEGMTAEVSAKQGKVTDAGRIRADLRGISRAAHLTLKLRLSRMPEREDAPFSPGVNEYPVWVYPAALPEDCNDDEIRVYPCVCGSAEKDLRAGKKILILSEGTKEALPQSRAVTFRPDFWSPMFHSADGDGYVLGCCIDARHPVFCDFPTGGFADWQWYDLIEGSRAVVLNDLPAEIEPAVQAIPTIDRGERLGILFEAKAAGGRLLVCSLDLAGSPSPAAGQLLYSIRKYMRSENFHPAVEADIELIRELLPEKNGRTAGCETEHGKMTDGERKAEKAERNGADKTGMPADKTAFFEALEQAGEIRREDCDGDRWEHFSAVYRQAKSFGALTEASRRQTDAMTEKLRKAVSELLEGRKEGGAV